MISHRKLLRLQWALLVGCLGLLVIYAAAYRRLSSEARALDQPLTAGWKKLLDATQGNTAIEGLDDPAMSASRERLEKALALVQQAGQRARLRIELEPELRAKLKEPFQLLDFDKAKLEVITNLRKLAEARKVTLAEPVLKGFPEFTSDLAKPALLWAQLAFVNQLLTAAVVNEPAAIRTLSLQPPKSHVTSDGKEVFLEEFRLRLELNGPPDSVVSFLRSVPLRSNELKEAGSREVPGKNQPLFVEHFMLKNSTNALNDAYLDLVVSGFVSPN
ncbi:MAG: hypothetical protein HYY24_07210 [Verrucomicrobia bacterium]|nr:hypothetical protein [Verrucomicrobiota bacterium]